MRPIRPIRPIKKSGIQESQRGATADFSCEQAFCWGDICWGDFIGRIEIGRIEIARIEVEVDAKNNKLQGELREHWVAPEQYLTFGS